MADDRKYPNSGALFSQRAQGKRPTWSGNIALDGKLLRELVDNWKANGEAKLSVSGWDREGRNGAWISLSVERYGAWKERAPARGRDDRGRDDRDDRDRDDRGRDDRDRGSSRSRNDDDRRSAPRGREERRDDRDLDDEIPF
jgi:hypothetical protein